MYVCMCVSLYVYIYTYDHIYVLVYFVYMYPVNAECIWGVFKINTEAVFTKTGMNNE